MLGNTRTFMNSSLSFFSSCLMTAANVPYVFVDSEAPRSRFAQHRVVFAPSFEMASRQRWGTLVELAGDAHVVYGPHLPILDERLRRRRRPRERDPFLSPLSMMLTE